VDKADFETAFDPTPGRALILENLCRNPADEETREEIHALVGLEWPSVPIAFWRTNYTSLFFLTDFGFHYYFPSVCVHSLSDYDQVHLAVHAALTIFSPSHEDAGAQRWLANRWGVFSGQQREVVRRWFQVIRPQAAEYRCQADIDKILSGPLFSQDHGSSQ